MALLAIMFSSASCEKYILPNIELSRDSLFFTASADSATVYVISNVQWKVSVKTGDASFCTFTPDQGFAEGEITFRVKDAIKTLAECEIEVRSEIISKSLYIRQSVQQTSE